MVYRVSITRAGVTHDVRVLTQDDVYALTKLMPDGFADTFTVEEIGGLSSLADRHGDSTPAPSFTCPDCGAVSYNPGDIENSYCGRCHEYKGPRR